MFKRIIGILLCTCILFQTLHKPILAETDTALITDDFMRQVIRNFDDSFKTSDYYHELTTHKHYYMQWIENIHNQNGFSYIITHATNYLLDNDPSTDDYMEYLTKLILLLESEFSEAISAQAELTVKQNLGTLSGGLMLSALFLDKDIKEDFEGLYSYTTNTLKLTEKFVKDVTHLSIMAIECAKYENRMTVLKTIRDYTNNENLKKAAVAVMEFYNYQFSYIIDQYSNLFKDVVVSFAELHDLTALYKDIQKKLKNTSEAVFTTWLRNAYGNQIADKILSGFAKCLKVKSIWSSFSLGLEIGAEIMKIWVGDQASLFKEMRAMDEIRRALVKGFEMSRFSAMSGNRLLRYKKIEQYVAIGKALIYTHLRGEYLNIQSRSEKEHAHLEAEYYNKWFVPQLMEYYDILDSILSGAELAIKADEVMTDDTQYIVRAKPINSNLWGYVDLRTGEMVIDAKYSDADAEFNKQGTATVYNQYEECALINIKGEHVFLFGQIDSALDYYEGEYTVIQKEKNRCFLYKGKDECFEFNIPMFNPEEAFPTWARYYQSSRMGNRKTYIPERFIPIQANSFNGEYFIYWFDETGKLICTSEDIDCGLAHNEYNYFFYTDDHLQYLGLDGSFIKEEYVPYIPQVDYDGDKWYVNENKFLKTNGMITIERIQAVNGFGLKATDGIIISEGIVYLPDGVALFYDMDFSELTYQNGYLKTETNGFCDQNGNTLYPYDEGTNGYDYSSIYPDGYYIYRNKDGLCGIRNLDGRVVCEAIYEAIGDLD